MILPAKRFYYGLIIGLLIAVLVAILNFQVSLFTLLLFNIIFLTLMIIDGIRVKENKTIVKRNPLQKLSIARENLVTISVKAKNQNAKKGAMGKRQLARELRPPFSPSGRASTP